jgi:hypothetical protein
MHQLSCMDLTMNHASAARCSSCALLIAWSTMLSKDAASVHALAKKFCCRGTNKNGPCKKKKTNKNGEGLEWKKHEFGGNESDWFSLALLCCPFFHLMLRLPCPNVVVHHHTRIDRPSTLSPSPLGKPQNSRSQAQQSWPWWFQIEGPVMEDEWVQCRRI